jgi:hypothetical protein
VLCGQ